MLESSSVRLTLEFSKEFDLIEPLLIEPASSTRASPEFRLAAKVVVPTLVRPALLLNVNSPTNFLSCYLFFNFPYFLF